MTEKDILEIRLTIMEQVRAAGWKAGVPAENVRLVVTDEMYAILFDAFDALACEIYNVMHDGCFAIAYVPETLGGAS